MATRWHRSRWWPRRATPPSSSAGRSVPGWGVDGRRGWVNVSCTTLSGLVRTLGEPCLAAQGRRLVSPALDLEVIGAQARAATGWLGHFSSHPSAPVELQRALDELRRCPPAALDTIRRGGGRGADLVALLGAVAPDPARERPGRRGRPDRRGPGRRPLPPVTGPDRRTGGVLGPRPDLPRGARAPATSSGTRHRRRCVPGQPHGHPHRGPLVRRPRRGGAHGGAFGHRRRPEPGPRSGSKPSSTPPAPPTPVSSTSS